MKKAKIKIKAAKPNRTAEKEEKPEISWQAPEFQYRQKDLSWYWISLIFAIILLSISLWQKNFLFAVFIIIAWLVIIYSSRRQAAVWKFKMDEKGIEIRLANNDPASAKFYSFEEAESFSIQSPAAPEISEETGEPVEKYQELILKMKNRFSPYLKMNFPAENGEKIKDLLLQFLPEKEYSASVADSISKLIGF